ncbi:MAG: recombination protein RecR [Bacteroidales bacterium]|nr:recombination protein RecR [Bacteroidales bacterium]
MTSFSSKLLETAVAELSRLPGVGKRTALRLALHLLREDPSVSESLGSALIKLRSEIKYCAVCHNISDHDVCEICKNPQRNKAILCVVEDLRDVMAIETTGQYFGVYHVLGGKISPIDGVGPADLTIEELMARIGNGGIEEVFLALSSTLEGDTTNYYLYKLLKEHPLKITTIARGISVGDELEYADEITLGRSIIQRIPFESTLGGGK